jgi:hypothetical protein
LCEGYRRLASPGLPGNTRKAARVIEEYAEGLASTKELLDARSRAWDAVTRFWGQLGRRALSAPDHGLRLHHARMAAVAQGTNPSLDGLFDLAVPALLRVVEETSWAAACLRDLFGPLPFRPVTLDAWLTPDVAAVARAAYEERSLPAGALDPARLAVLADALEEIGCDNSEVLAHLRGPGPHVRGCWAVDLTLGRG